MCGIVGFTGKKNIPKLSKLLTIVEHRGRDGRAFFFANGVHMGMNRLAIIDLTRDPYPMKYKHYTLVFNGEIYNFKTLKDTLVAKGISFQTSCDAEVILPLFHLYGPRAFSMLEGMFAISIYDSVKKRLILVRDKSGEKPIYILKSPSFFAFASEIKVLLSFDKKTKQLNIPSLYQYLRQGFVFTPHTLVKGIEKVPPSHYVVYDIVKKKKRVSRYWNPISAHNVSFHKEQERTYRDRFEILLRESVRLRLIADVPVGCFLSGGIDSSLVTLFASQTKKNLRTYSVSFPGYAKLDESKFALFVAHKLNTNHMTVPCTAESVRKFLDRIGILIDEPIIDPAVLPTLLMAQEARKHVKVVLTGEGADELFGGYTRYQKHLMIEGVRRVIQRYPLFPQLWSFVFKTRFQSVTKNLADRYSPQCVWNDKELTRLLSQEPGKFPRHAYLRQFASSNPLLAMQLTDYRGYMAEQLLMKIDKSTMATNLEARAPYLDTQIISFALHLPDDIKSRNLQGKYIIRRVAEQYFPRTFVWRKKHGFDIPLRDWFRGELRSYVCKSVHDLEDYGHFFRVQQYQRIVEDHMEQKADNSDKIWSILVLVSWMKAHDISV